MPHTIASLRLDVEKAKTGRTCFLLPFGFRHHTEAAVYPLPASREELQTIACIPVPPQGRDGGSVYIRRVIKALRKKNAGSMLNRANDLDMARHTLDASVHRMKLETQKAIEQVRNEASKATASLAQLFDLGRSGIEGQMKAHLAGSEWMGEPISAKDFRDCFRMVLQGVKGLGLPSDQRAVAVDVVMQEIADSLKDTQETVALAPGADAETSH